MLATARATVTRKVRLSVMTLVALATLSVSLFVSTPTASAAVSGCTGISISGYAACVSADMGTKNTSDHTQWVGNVTAYKTNGGTSTLTEIWGDGFYYSHSGNDSSHTWAVNKWVASGTNICAAFTYTSGREIACIGISV